MLNEKGDLLVVCCPVCGSEWIGYHCWLEKYGCLACGWVMSRECKIGDHDDLKIVTAVR